MPQFTPYVDLDKRGGPMTHLADNTLKKDACDTLISFDGAFAGPTLLVICTQDVFEDVADKLAQIPSLPWMKGRIILVDDASETAGLALCGIEDEIDISMRIPDPREPHNKPHFTVLRRCTALGMISGRGVPMHGHEEELALAS
jgi:hypothetical protein